MFQFSTPRHRGHASVLAIDEKVRDRRGATAGACMDMHFGLVHASSSHESAEL